MSNKVGHCQIQEIPCWHSRSHMYSPTDWKIGQNVGLDKIPNKSEFGSPGVTN